MATNTYVALATTTISGTSTNSITFSSIPQGYTDLVLVTNLNNIGGVAVLRGQINGDTATNYSSTALNGDGSSASSGRQSNVNAFYMTYQGHVNSTKGVGIYNFPNYSNTTTFKTVLSRSSNASIGVDAIVSTWRSTAAITSITILNDRAEYWTAGSTFSIYGIKAQVTPGTAKATGGTITYDAYGNVYHTFTGNGTFTPSQALTCDYLVVAGGGGGGSAGSAGGRGAGGGGAGGYRASFGSISGGGAALESPLAVTASTPYVITVGGGGSVAANDGGANGASSTFATVTSTGGGGGGGWNNPLTIAAKAGGSGGGAQDGIVGNTSGGAGISGQGYRGGNNAGNGGGTGGSGGGGAGGIAFDQTGAQYLSGTAGGVGVALATASTTTTYAVGANGGGTSGNVVGAAGTANTGNGGGGASGGSGTILGGVGGSGVVIIRYSGV